MYQRGISGSLSVMLITISLASNVTNELVIRWCITEWVKRLAGNEIELGIGYRRSNLGQVTYRWQREQRCCYAVWPIKIFVEYVGTNMASRSRYWLLTREVSRSCLHSSRTRRVRTLNVRWRFVLWVMCFDDRSLFGVPDEITDVTRSLEMVET